MSVTMTMPLKSCNRESISLEVPLRAKAAKISTSSPADKAGQEYGYFSGTANECKAIAALQWQLLRQRPALHASGKGIAYK